MHLLTVASMGAVTNYYFDTYEEAKEIHTAINDAIVANSDYSSANYKKSVTLYFKSKYCEVSVVIDKVVSVNLEEHNSEGQIEYDMKLKLRNLKARKELEDKAKELGYIEEKDAK